MAKAGWSTKQIISGMGGVLDATAASGENLGTVATITADAITGFGLKAKDSSRVADLMTQAANAGTIGVSDLGESYKYISPIAQSMGLSIEDTTQQYQRCRWQELKVLRPERLLGLAWQTW